MKPCASSREWVYGHGNFIKVNCGICRYDEDGPTCNNCVVDAPVLPYEKLIILLTKEGTEK